jgi:putative chitinase
MSFTFNFNLNNLRQNIPTNREPEQWFNEMTTMLPKYNITTRLRVAAFLAQCAHESSDFRILEENLNYSEQGLRTIFSKYFPNGLEKSYARNPQRIANRVYANRMGNGPESSGDGWRYRGRGVIQLTGFNNYQAFGNYIGMTPLQVIEYVQTKRGALESACWFWSSRNLNVPADRGDTDRVTRLINGGTHGLADRTFRYNRALSLFGPDNIQTPRTENTNTVSNTNNSTPPPAINTQATQNTVRITLEPVRRGSRGETVRMIQQYLKIDADGIFGQNTENSLRRWQQFNKLSATGIADINTLRKMFPNHFA